MGGLATQEWSTSGGDAQRSSWIRRDALISKSAMSTGKFGFLWKLKVSNQARQLSYFSRPVLVGNAMGIKGFRSLTVLAGASNTVFAVDNDFGVMYWEKQFDAAIPALSTAPCPGGMTAAATRATNPNPAALASGRPGIRRPYGSTLGEPGAGAPMNSGGYLPGGGGGRANAAGRGATADAAPAAGSGGRAGEVARRGDSHGAQPIAVLASDGVLHFVSPISAKELLAVPFIRRMPTRPIWPGSAVSPIRRPGRMRWSAGAVWAIRPQAEPPATRGNQWRRGGDSGFGSDGTVYAAPMAAGTQATRALWSR
jgi:hypothetical protein